ncbi:MAG: hypothetical protein KGR26_12160, partial [Cyanobacteria bacterium REEB65]|nr:hypothetical protein [Cyanobacteria bacterium REEB65]
MNHYQYLGVPRDAGAGTVRQAAESARAHWNRRLALAEGVVRLRAEEALRRIAEAEAVLLDPDRRAAYDLRLPALGNSTALRPVAPAAGPTAPPTPAAVRAAELSRDDRPGGIWPGFWYLGAFIVGSSLAAAMVMAAVATPSGGVQGTRSRFRGSGETAAAQDAIGPLRQAGRLLALDRPFEAEIQCRIALARDPQLPLVYYDLAVCFHREHRDAMAVQEFKTFLTLAPADRVAPAARS